MVVKNEFYFILFFDIKYLTILNNNSINMPIQYGELTIIHDKQEFNLLSNVLSWFNYEKKISQNSKFIFLFEDGEICDYNNESKNFNFCFSQIKDKHNSHFPLYFNKNIKNSKIYKKNYFLKPPTIKDTEYFVDFNKLFGKYIKYNHFISKASIYNCIYFYYKGSEKNEAFGIVNIKSNEYMPRYQFAYDNKEFTKEEIIYLIHYIFNDKINNTNL